MLPVLLIGVGEEGGGGGQHMAHYWEPVTNKIAAIITSLSLLHL